jgi:hypothetical protein
MKRHQLMKVMTYTFGVVFLLSASGLTFAAFWNHALFLKVFGLIFCNSVIAMLIPIGFFGDDLDIPWRN